MESNHFMLECASICPETTHQKLESQRTCSCLYNLTSMEIHVHYNVGDYKSFMFPTNYISCYS